MSTYISPHPGWRRRRTKSTRIQATRIAMEPSDGIGGYNAPCVTSNGRIKVSVRCGNPQHPADRMDEYGVVGSRSGRRTARVVENNTRVAEDDDGGQRQRRRRRSELADAGADAEAWGIPPGYSTKSWDREEVPILLLGSVFDANSLGKWVFDWTVYRWCDGGAPIPQIAGDLWLLLIKLAANIQSAKWKAGRAGSVNAGETLDDLVVSGARLWRKVEELVKTCEGFMWRVATVGEDGASRMGDEAGEEFVATMFGRDRQLERTEQLMTSVRLWNMRFEANCKRICQSRGTTGLYRMKEN